MTKNNPNPTPAELQTVLDRYHFERTQDGETWRRYDTEGPEPEFRFLAASGWDITPVYRHWEGNNYDHKCACCWLGIAHTTAMHERSVAGWF